jgi:uncharacterized protein
MSFKSPALKAQLPMHGSSNDGASPNGSGTPPSAQSHGQAALLLTESLMHCLVAKGALTREDFVEVVEGAAEVELELVGTGASSPTDQGGSLLDPLASAFRKELGR